MLELHISKYYNRKDTKNLYSLLNKAFGPKSSYIIPLMSNDQSNLIKAPNKILYHWQELVLHSLFL